ncbi:MAG: hypothetical protein EOO75_03365 [Myxococcales bacterium]|nr:MAG: hypothetical protein EOO75_03365 [Myxococcales bacterium]
MTWERFVAVIAASPRACWHRPRWQRELGAGLLAALQASGLLASRGRADWFPCGGACGGQSQRVVLDEPLGPDRWRAVCGHEVAGCLDVSVGEDELTLLEASPEALRRWWRETLGATGPPVSFERLPQARGLGRVAHDGEPREAFLVPGVAGGGLAAVLEACERARLLASVFVPSFVGVDASLRARHAPGAPVSLEALADLVSLADGRLALRPPRPAPTGTLTAREPTAPPYAAPSPYAAPPVPTSAPAVATSAPAVLTSAPAVARRLDASGQRALSLGEYEALVARRQDLDLFIDLTAPGAGRGCRAWVRRDGGPGADVDLPAGEAAALVELIEARRALRVGEFRRVQVSAIGKLVERARRRVEGERRPGTWRFFQTISGVDPAAKSYVFRPAAGLTWAAVVAV